MLTLQINSDNFLINLTFIHQLIRLQIISQSFYHFHSNNPNKKAVLLKYFIYLKTYPPKKKGPVANKSKFLFLFTIFSTLFYFFEF